MAKELPKRSEVKEEYTWDLSDMYASKEAWDKELEEVLAITGEIEKMEGKVTATAADLLFTLEQSAKAEQKLELAGSYASRLYDQDQKNTAHQAMFQKIMALFTDYGSCTAFIVPEILAADENVLEGFMPAPPILTSSG